MPEMYCIMHGSVATEGLFSYRRLSNITRGVDYWVGFNDWRGNYGYGAFYCLVKFANTPPKQRYPSTAQLQEFTTVDSQVYFCTSIGNLLVLLS